MFRYLRVAVLVAKAYALGLLRQRGVPTRVDGVVEALQCHPLVGNTSNVASAPDSGRYAEATVQLRLPDYANLDALFRRTDWVGGLKVVIGRLQQVPPRILDGPVSRCRPLDFTFLALETDRNGALNFVNQCCLISLLGRSTANTHQYQAGSDTGCPEVQERSGLNDVCLH